MRIIGKENLSAAEQEQMKEEVGTYYGIMSAGTLVGAFVFSLFIRWLNARRRSRGCRSASGRGLGSSFPLAVEAALFSGKEKGLIWLLFLVQTGHSLVGMLVMRAILGGCRLYPVT